MNQATVNHITWSCLPNSILHRNGSKLALIKFFTERLQRLRQLLEHTKQTGFGTDAELGRAWLIVFSRIIEESANSQGPCSLQCLVMPKVFMNSHRAPLNTHFINMSYGYVLITARDKVITRYVLKRNYHAVQCKEKSIGNKAINLQSLVDSL